jgi:transcriptional regulator of arginine metabolism
MKSKRQSKIIELVRNRDVCTQAELTQLLQDAGIEATQATVSRDIRELKLTKITAPGGLLKYSLTSLGDMEHMPRLTRVFRDGLVSVDYAGNMLVIRTLNGMAMAVAAALDAMEFPEILGSVAGDDAVLCVVKTEEQAGALAEKLRK